MYRASGRFLLAASVVLMLGLELQTGMQRMKKFSVGPGLIITQSILKSAIAQSNAYNPIIFSDVPDMSMIRVGDTYYMSTTSMHMSPGVPIVKSKDLVNRQLINHAYDTLVSNSSIARW